MPERRLRKTRTVYTVKLACADVNWVTKGGGGGDTKVARRKQSSAPKFLIIRPRTNILSETNVNERAKQTMSRTFIPSARLLKMNWNMLILGKMAFDVKKFKFVSKEIFTAC